MLLVTFSLKRRNDILPLIYLAWLWRHDDAQTQIPSQLRSKLTIFEAVSLRSFQSWKSVFWFRWTLLSLEKTSISEFFGFFIPKRFRRPQFRCQVSDFFDTECDWEKAFFCSYDNLRRPIFMLFWLYHSTTGNGFIILGSGWAQASGFGLGSGFAKSGLSPSGFRELLENLLYPSHQTCLGLQKARSLWAIGTQAFGLWAQDWA